MQPVFAAASIAQRSGQPEKAGRLFTDAVKRQPDNAITWFRLAGFQVLLTDSPAALRSIATARSLDPQNALLAFVHSFTRRHLPRRGPRRRRGSPPTAPRRPAAPAPRAPAPAVR